MKEDNSDEDYEESDKSKIYIIAGGIVLGIILVIAGILFFNKHHETTASDVLANDSDSIAYEEQLIGGNEQDEIEEVKDLLKNPTYNTYRNEEFGYAVPYPSCFKVKEGTDNEGGRTLTLGHYITIKIKAKYNTDGSDITKLFRAAKNNEGITYSRQKHNWYVIAGNLPNNKIFWKKVIQKSDDYENDYILEFKVTCPEKYSNIVSDFIEYEHKEIK